MAVLPKDKEEVRMSKLSVHLPAPSAWLFLFLSKVIIIQGHAQHTTTCSTRVEAWHDAQPCLVGLIGMRPWRCAYSFFSVMYSPTVPRDLILGIDG